ncbi:hypothetical protein [Streptomyces cavernae]|uniref:hypothetical protein n=1 Tax=Streptomyces cavernae TaxID=2259034 RepID=UPI000FEC083D|nr:hypothetical protein [Streptomyces cavernae]
MTVIAQPFTATPEYLAAAREAGTLVRVGDRDCVMGVSTDDLTGELSCLIQYAAPPPAGHDWAEQAARLSGHVAASLPDVTGVFLRTPPEAQLPAPWERRLTYVHHDGSPDVYRHAPSSGDPFTVRTAEAGHTPAVNRWLTEALEIAAREQGHPVRHEAAMQQAALVLEKPGRTSFIATVGDEPLGHATTLPFTDEVTGIAYLELVDVLVAASPKAPAMTEALVRTCLDQAATAALPLLGHVVHHTAASDRDAHGRRVLASLLRKGWRTNHVFWHTPVPRSRG